MQTSPSISSSPPGQQVGDQTADLPVLPGLLLPHLLPLVWQLSPTGRDKRMAGGQGSSFPESELGLNLVKEVLCLRSGARDVRWTDGSRSHSWNYSFHFLPLDLMTQTGTSQSIYPYVTTEKQILK